MLTRVSFSQRRRRAFRKTNVLGLALSAKLIECRDGLLERRVWRFESASMLANDSALLVDELGSNRWR